MHDLAVPIAQDFLVVVLDILVDGLRDPVVLFARHVRSALNEQDALAAGRQAIGQRSTARARADDDDVKVFVHEGSWSVARGKPYRSEGHTIPVAPSLCPVTMVSQSHVPGRNKLEAWPEFMIEFAALLSTVKLKKSHEAHSRSSHARSLVRPRSGL